MIARMKKSALKPIVTQNNTFSIPRRAVKTPPVSPPVSPPNPAPLLCKITLAIKAIDVIIKDASTHLLTGNLRVKSSSDKALQDSLCKLFLQPFLRQADYTFRYSTRLAQL